MFAHLFTGFRILHGLLLALAAVGFFTLWVRTRFWLPTYVHVLAAIGLIVGIISMKGVTADAPIARYGIVGKSLLALALPAIVYVFFIFRGGQHAAYRRKTKSASEIADIVERFVNGKSLYSDEWGDFVKHRHPDVRLESYRRRCYALGGPFDSSPPRAPETRAELEKIAEELRTRG